MWDTGASQWRSNDWIAGVFAGAAGLATAGAQVPDASGRPNILDIMTDRETVGDHCRPVGLPHAEYRSPGARGAALRAQLHAVGRVLSGARHDVERAYHWHNGVYNQVHSPPSVHRDMNADVVLYSQRLRDAGYRLGYVGKWHASYLRTPLDFGFHEVAGINGCDPALLQKLDLNPDRVPRSTERLTVTNEKMMRWPGSEPFAMWGYKEGPEEATPEYRNAEPRRA